MMHVDKQLAEQIAALVEGPAADRPEDDDTQPRPAASGSDGGDDGIGAARAWGFDVEGINADHALVLIGSKAVVVMEHPKGPIHDRVRMLSLPAFNAWLANRRTEIVGADRKVRVVTWAQAWLSHRRRRQYMGLEFFPNPDGAEGTPGYLNLWHGFEVQPSPAGTYDIFRDHLLNNICDGNGDLFNYVFAWFAHIVQRPRERIGTALVLRGRMGSGKTKVGEVFGSLFPAHYFLVDDPRYVTGQFNSHMTACLLLQADEAVWAGDKSAEGRLKGLVTSAHQMIEAKGIDPFQIPNYVRLMMTSNENWVVPAAKEERRFCVLDVNPRCVQNYGYFREMDAQLHGGGRARLLRDLQSFDLGAVNLRQIPRTRALLEQKIRSLDSIEHWWFNRLSDGSPTRDADEWPERIAIAALYADYIRAADEVGIGRKREESVFGTTMFKLVPDLDRIRPRIDGKRRWCYALPPLDTCRAAFAEMVGQLIEWPADEAGEDERVDTAGDGVVPL